MSPLQDLLTFLWNDFIFGFGLNNELLSFLGLVVIIEAGTETGRSALCYYIPP
jgi:hypothetical protein